MLPDFFHVFGYFGHFPFFGPKGSPEISDASQRGGAKILDRSSRGVKKTVDHPQGGKEFRCFQIQFALLIPDYTWTYFM